MMGTIVSEPRSGGRLAGIADAARARAERRRELERRLSEGWGYIDRAIAECKDVAAWEQRWLRLLAEYDAACEEQVRAALAAETGGAA